MLPGIAGPLLISGRVSLLQPYTLWATQQGGVASAPANVSLPGDGEDIFGGVFARPRLTIPAGTNLRLTAMVTSGPCNLQQQSAGGSITPITMLAAGPIDITFAATGQSETEGYFRFINTTGGGTKIVTDIVLTLA